jgi:hypothetical protein
MNNKTTQLIHGNNNAIDDVKQIKDVFVFMKIICFYYSNKPNDTLKKKYYDVLSNIPVYYPNEFFTKEYLDLLNSNPVVSFLDSRDDLLHWCHFIETTILKRLGLPSQNYASWLMEYHQTYEKPYHCDNKEPGLYNEYVFYGIILAVLISIIKYNM